MSHDMHYSGCGSGRCGDNENSCDEEYGCEKKEKNRRKEKKKKNKKKKFRFSEEDAESEKKVSILPSTFSFQQCPVRSLPLMTTKSFRCHPTLKK